MFGKATVVSIHVARTGAASMESVTEAHAVVGKGLEGDRYFSGVGTYSNEPGGGREVTLIEIEAIEALKRDYQIDLDPGQARRNVITRGVPLNHLLGQVFIVGEVTLRGVRLCEPCAHMEKLTLKGALRGLIHRGGLRTDIVQGGTIHVGDAILLESLR